MSILQVIKGTTSSNPHLPKKPYASERCFHNLSVDIKLNLRQPLIGLEFRCASIYGCSGRKNGKSPCLGFVTVSAVENNACLNHVVNKNLEESGSCLNHEQYYCAHYCNREDRDKNCPHYMNVKHEVELL